MSLVASFLGLRSFCDVFDLQRFSLEMKVVQIEEYAGVKQGLPIIFHLVYVSIFMCEISSARRVQCSTMTLLSGTRNACVYKMSFNPTLARMYFRSVMPGTTKTCSPFGAIRFL